MWALGERPGAHLTFFPFLLAFDRRAVGYVQRTIGEVRNDGGGSSRSLLRSCRGE
jgi:hypothetical protein